MIATLVSEVVGNLLFCFFRLQVRFDSRTHTLVLIVCEKLCEAENSRLRVLKVIGFERYVKWLSRLEGWY